MLSGAAAAPWVLGGTQAHFGCPPSRGGWRLQKEVPATVPTLYTPTLCQSGGTAERQPNRKDLSRDNLISGALIGLNDLTWGVPTPTGPI